MSKINTDQPERFNTQGKPRILVAPLDWGLGHATRCIPVIYELIGQGAAPWLAAEGAQEDLLRSEFPDLPFLRLNGYRVKYARSAPGLIRSLLFQTPRLLQTIRNEHEWLKNACTEHAFDAIISDNRYGLWHASLPSIFITHQLRIKTPFGKWSESILQKRNYRSIDRFSECWVADEEKENNLAGELSHPAKLPNTPVRYTGLLSRMKPAAAVERKGHLFISLSGPEPQRTALENILLRDIAHHAGTATIARGLPGNPNLIPSTNDIRFYNHLNAADYNKEIQSAEYVIARSGYSTVMDLAALGKKSILIPTPGQTEQEYLAKHLSAKNLALAIDQKNFRLETALQKAAAFSYDVRPLATATALPALVQGLLQRIKK